MNATLCDQICENTEGNFTCACLDGYQLTEEGNQCQGACLEYVCHLYYHN